MLRLFLLLSIISLISCSSEPSKNTDKNNKELAQKILSNSNIKTIKAKGQELLKSGFNAGDGYAEVWIRDFNTFVNQSSKVVDHSLIRENLINFFHIQEEDGNICDGFVVVGDDYDSNYYKRSSLKNVVYHKNTVETDQESSLVQAVYKYIKATGDKSILDEEVKGIKVIDRIENSMTFLLQHRFDKKYGLLWGATTSDWGDVQPEHDWGVEIDENTHYSIDIYDNAMFVIALNNMIEFGVNSLDISKWTTVKSGIEKNIAKYLWDNENQKYIPHVYLDGSPFPDDFDENKIYYHGGTAIAIEANLLTKDEIQISIDKMIANVKESGAPSIGLTMYPTYPEGYFKNKGMYPYGYQNGGDWTWFGARMIKELIDNGFVEEAWEQAQPMFDRVIENDGFYEWYTKDNKPNGSGMFRGSAGVLLDVIDSFDQWAEKNNTSYDSK